jgi:hypothetical protein
MELAPLSRRLGARRLLGGRVRGIVRWAAPAVYAVVLAVFVWRDGLPVARDRLLLWIVLGLLAVSTTNVRGWLRGVLLEWLPLAVVLAAYDLLRGQADGLLFSPHFRPQLDADRLLFGGTIPTVWLQEHLWDGAANLHWYDYGAWLVYASYFLATYLLAGVLWFFARDRFRRYVATVALLAAMAFVTFALFPAAPPWLASDEGLLPSTERSIGVVSGHLPIVSFEGLYERGSEYANPVAAVPSLHAAYTLLIVLVLWGSARWAGPLLVAYPLAMAFALVYTAEHYVSDILIGWGYTLAAVWLVNRVADALAARRSAARPVRARRRAGIEP